MLVRDGWVRSPPVRGGDLGAARCARTICSDVVVDVQTALKQAHCLHDEARADRLLPAGVDEVLAVLADRFAGWLVRL